MGARPLSRLIQEKLKKPLASEILFGKLEDGGRVEVRIKDDDVVFEFKKASAPERESQPVSRETRRG